jgi:hypothetical protein
MTIQERVAKGAALLDVEHPRWAAEIAVEDLRMASCDACVLGQIYGRYSRGVRRLDLNDTPSGGFIGGRAADHGFTLTDNEHREERIGAFGDDRSPVWGALADAWRAEITRRVQA